MSVARLGRSDDGGTIRTSDSARYARVGAVCRTCADHA